LGCSTLGQSSCIPLRTFRHRGLVQMYSSYCTNHDCSTKMWHNVANPWVQLPVLHDCQQKLPMFGKSLGMCLCFVCCLGFKDMITSPAWIHRCVFSRFWWYDFTKWFPNWIPDQCPGVWWLCLPLYPYGGVLKHYKPSILGHLFLWKPPYHKMSSLCLSHPEVIGQGSTPPKRPWPCVSKRCLPQCVCWRTASDGSGRETETGRPGFQVNHTTWMGSLVCCDFLFSSCSLRGV
jgi:hypothetical protein